VSNSTNKTWLSPNELQDEAKSLDNHVLITPTSGDSQRAKGQKLDNSEVIVYSPVTMNDHNDDYYDQSELL